MLSVARLSASYGAIAAVRGVDLEVPAGALCVVLGANGAGKSTTLRAIAGLHRPVSGSIKLEGQEISRLPLHRVVRAGLAFVPEGRMVVGPLTVEENLGLSLFSGRNRDPRAQEEIYALFPRLAERRRQKAGLMSGGEQQMLAIGRALMTRPRLLALDEPSMGLAPAIVDVVYEAIAALHQRGQSILLVEQNAELALSVATHVYLMRRGVIVAEGPPGLLRQGDALQAAYLA